MDDIEFDDPELETEALREDVDLAQSPSGPDADERVEELPDEPLDDLSPGEDLLRDDWGSVEPNEPA